MKKTYVIDTAGLHQILHEFACANSAHSFARKHPSRQRLALRELDVAHTLWTVHAPGDLPLFCFLTEQDAIDFIDRNIAAALQGQSFEVQTDLDCLSKAEQMTTYMQALRDQFAIERRFVLADGSVIREWHVGQCDSFVQP